MDALTIVAKGTNEIKDILMKNHGFKLKVTCPIKYHLESDFFRDESKVLCFSPRKYTDKTIEGY